MSSAHKPMTEMKFREFLVAHAMNGLLAHGGNAEAEAILAGRAISVADAVLAELAKRDGPKKP